ncbi:MAG: MTH1187 family thiamine-binding protein [Syntrophobacteraceae bacterium]
MAIVEISVVPIGIEDTSLSKYVAKAVQIAKESSLTYELTAMGTIISGEMEAVWEVLKKMHESCFIAGVGRVLTTIKIDDRRDKPGTPDQKIRSVLLKLA